MCPHCGKYESFNRMKVRFFSKTLPLQCNSCGGSVQFSSKGEFISILGFVFVIGSNLLLKLDGLTGLILALLSITLGFMLILFAKRRETIIPYKSS
jgi:uncharacterized protein (DUF983 family)